MFTEVLLIRKNTAELREMMLKLGYECINSGGTTLDAHNYDGKGNHKSIEEGNAIITSYGGYYGVIYDIDEVAKKGRIDCGTNEKLFLALAALRDDTDYMQYFVCGGSFVLCDRDSWLDMYSVLHSGNKYTIDELDNAHIATVEELIEHFKDK